MALTAADVVVAPKRLAYPHRGHRRSLTSHGTASLLARLFSTPKQETASPGGSRRPLLGPLSFARLPWRVVDMGEPGPRANVANPALGTVGLGSLPRTPRHDSTGTPRRRPFSTG